MEASRKVALEFVEIDDNTLPLVTFRFKAHEPTDEQFNAYLDFFKHIINNVATDEKPVVIMFDLRKGTTRNLSIISKQVKFNKQMRPLFYERLGATAILVDSEFYRNIIKMVFTMVKRVRPNHACRCGQEAKAYLKKELAKFLVQKAERANFDGGSAE